MTSFQWIVNAYTLVFASLILTAGALGDRLGARRVFIAGFAIFAAGSLACALSPSTAILIGAGFLPHRRIRGRREVADRSSQ